MMFQARSVLLIALTALLALPLSASAAKRTRAGVAKVDATWHVGASAGQFTDDTGPAGAAGVDPHHHSTKKRISDGVALRTSTRALVVEDTEGDRIAVVSTDLYLPQDLLTRRVAGLLAEHDAKVRAGLAKGPVTGIGPTNLAVTASHNHNTPYYSTPGWGTAIFQDVFDVRFYDYISRRMARAVIRAGADMVPVRMGGATSTFNEIQAHTYGPKVGDDGTPAGQPYDHTTKQLSVLRLDDVSNRKKPKPFATWVVFGVHPEWTWGYDLINGDITHAAARMVDRDLETTSVFSQRETGTSGPHKDRRAHEPEARREFEDNGFAELDRGARLLADGIKRTYRDIGRGTPENEAAYQPMVEDFDVASVSQRFAPPATRPYPGVSNCNTYALFHGDPRLPVLGLPDCRGPRGAVSQTAPVLDLLKPHTSALYHQLKALGVPVPESYSATALTAVEETAAVHLMAFKLGDTVATFCPCEQFTDTALNIQSRLDKVAGNLHKGFDWTARKTPSGRDWCVPAGQGKWSCADPRNPSADLPPIDQATYDRFRAQINNDATGWELSAETLGTLGSEAEPADHRKIKGNFTHEEFPQHGFKLAMSVGMANDYWGYVPEYREYRSHDHYRKALSGLGPHGADFLATRLARLGASLNGAPAVEPSPADRVFLAEQGRAEAVATGLGALGRAATVAYEKALPADGGKPGIIKDESVDGDEKIKRFSAAHVTWVGGSNYTDLPEVRVERRVGKRWERYGDTHGDVQIMVGFPKPEQLGEYRAGTFAWQWTAAFEAFSSDVAQPDARGVMRRSTPSGEYRFVIEGRHRPATGAKPDPYRLESDSFHVAPWDGITATDLRVEEDGTVSFVPGPAGRPKFGDREYAVGPIDYPDTYTSPFRFLDGKRKLFTYGLSDPSRHQQYCPRCAFRPWADAGDLEEAAVTFVKPGGQEHEVAARRGDDGRWRTVKRLGAGERAFIAPGALRDGFGETNGARSATVSR